MNTRLLNKIDFNLKIIRWIIVLFITFILGTFIYFFFGLQKNRQVNTEISVNTISEDSKVPFEAPSEWRMKKEENYEELKYGKDLIANTAYYLGPHGTVKQITNGLNCQNCHLEAGTKPWGNNYLAVEANYPQVRKRSGKLTDITGRVNGCLQRSLNGKPLDSTDKEMHAMVAYIQWIGQDSPKGTMPEGAKIFPIKDLGRAADPVLGKIIYEEKCLVCHQKDGQGVLADNGKTYTYPPLWGPHSYNDGAGLFRMSKIAGYVKMNMPFGVNYKNPQLSDEEAWDVGAFINSMPRPEKDKSKDWPKLADKPADHPFGPYIDPFTEAQHKYGPFGPIKSWYKNSKKSK